MKYRIYWNNIWRTGGYALGLGLVRYGPVHVFGTNTAQFVSLAPYTLHRFAVHVLIGSIVVELYVRRKTKLNN